MDDLADVATDRYPISALWETFRGRSDVMSVAHVGGRACNLDFFDPEFVRLAEVHSHHGTFEWFAEEVLARGFEVGFIGGSDDHTGRQGLVYPNRRSNNVVTFDVKGGLMGVYARDLTREAVWEAMGARRTYATNGERIYLKTSCGERWMGESFGGGGRTHYRSGSPRHRPASGRGAQARGRDHPPPHPLNVPRGGGRARRIRVEWSGVSQKSGRDKRILWRGGIALDKGAILSHVPYALDQYDDSLVRVSNKLLRFSTATSGDPDGVFIDVEAPDDAVLTFFSEQTTFRLPLGEVSAQPHTFDAGGVNARVLVCAVAENLSDWSARFSFTDEEAAVDATNPYWVRVLQADGGQAWSSPLYARRVG